MKSFALLVACTSLFVVAPVRADDPRARALLERGADLRERGRNEQALDAFVHANAIESTPRSIAQIGLTHGVLAHWVPAFEHLHQALAADQDPWIRSRWRALEAAMLDVRAHLGFLHFSGTRTGVHVVIGTRDLGPLPIEAPVAAEPGVVEVEVRVGDQVQYAQRVILEAGETAEVVITDQGAPAAPEPAPLPQAPIAESPVNQGPPADRAQASSVLPVLAWTSIGVGAAGVVTGVIFHVMREHEAGLANDCRTGTGACAEGAEVHVDRASTDLTLAIVGYAVGSAFVAAGVLALVFSDPDDGDTARASLRCGPAVGSLGAACAGTF